MVAPTREGAVDVSEDTYNALVVILSSPPRGTSFPNFRQRLSDVLRENENDFVQGIFRFHPQYHNSAQLDDGINLLVQGGLLSSWTDKSYTTNPHLYDLAPSARKYFSLEGVDVLRGVGRKLIV